MKYLLTIFALLILSGCASVPFQCNSTDPDVCAIETQLHKIAKAQEDAAFWSMMNGINSGQSKPRTHAEMMCAANPFKC